MRGNEARKEEGIENMIQLDNLSNSEKTNLATLHRLACAGSYNSTNNELLPEQLPFAAIYGTMRSCAGQTVKNS